ncbi:MAG: CtsR family transcriptional regulator [Ruthenibacterium sp.]
MGISDLIAGFIEEGLLETDGALELQRRELAEKFGCVPSQINYVMSTRFSPEHGYIVESRRGEGGYIRITRMQVDRETLLMQVINSLGDSLDLPTARAVIGNLAQAGALEESVARALLAAIGDAALRSVPREAREELRAAICKQVLVGVV